MNLRLILLATLTGCSQADDRDQGTVVGNPGDAALRIAPVDDGEVISARTSVSGMSLESCDGSQTEI